jgi:hypothetical protein
MCYPPSLGLSAIHYSDALCQPTTRQISNESSSVDMETLNLSPEQLQLAKNTASQRGSGEEVLENGKSTGIFRHSRSDAREELYRSLKEAVVSAAYPLNNAVADGVPGPKASDPQSKHQRRYNDIYYPC